MTKWARWSIPSAWVILTLVGLLTSGPERGTTATTFGTVPIGYGGIYDLLSELGLPVTRSYSPPDRLPRDATVWWIKPRFVLREEGPTAGARGRLKVAPWSGVQWIEGGGTAVVFLPGKQESLVPSLGGLVLPARVAVASAAPPRGDRLERSKGRRSAEGRPRWAAGAGDQGRRMQVKQVVEGALTPRPRQLETSGLRAFKEAGAWRVVATLDHRPFVLEHGVGRGRLVLVADEAMLRNAWLDRADAALLAVDLVRAFGVPRFDEREHGFRAELNVFRYLARSPALPVFAGLALTGLLFAWYGTAWPARSIADVELNAPTLEGFVSSLASLYARSGDYDSVLERYREFTAARLRRHFGLGPQTPLAVLVERLRGTRRVAPESLRALVKGPPVRGEAALRAAVRSLDALVLEATR